MDEENEEDFFLDEEAIDDLTHEEIEFRLKQALDLLRNVCRSVNISVMYDTKVMGETVVHEGFGTDFNRKGMVQHYISTVDNTWGINNDY